MLTAREQARNIRLQTAGASRVGRVVGVALSDTLRSARGALSVALTVYRGAVGTDRLLLREPDDEQLALWIGDAETELQVLDERIAALDDRTDAGRYLASPVQWLDRGRRPA